MRLKPLVVYLNNKSVILKSEILDTNGQETLVYYIENHTGTIC